MKKCKNDECDSVITDNRTYCSLRCRNVYVNKHLRDYTKVREAFTDKRTISITEYNKNPNYCQHCGAILPYKDKRKKFCNNSCAAIYNNTGKLRGKYNLSEVGLVNLRASALSLLGRTKKSEKALKEMTEYAQHPKLCVNCGTPIKFAKRNQDKCCSWKCKKEYFGNNLEPYNVYKSLTTFNFSASTYDEFNTDLIRKFGWYQAANRGNNLNGISRDHMLSVKVGYEQMINPLLLAHPANCELMQQNNNSSKHKKCSLNVDELLNRVSAFEAKYGAYYKGQLKTYITKNELNDLYIQTSKN
jgi:hypothetical protein